MFRYILLFFVLTSDLLAGDIVPQRQKRLSIGINASPDICYRSATAKRIERPILGYSLGSSLRWNRESYIVSLGIQFSQKGWKSWENANADLNTRRHEIRRHYSYVEIPIGVDLTRGEGKTKLLMHAGIAPAFLLHERRTKVFDDGHRERTAFNYIHDPFNLFLKFGIGAQIATGEGSNLQILPQLSYGARSTIYYVGTGIEYLYSVGIKLSWNFRP